MAKPMGKRVVGKNCEVRYTPETRTSTMAISLFAPMFCAPSAETVESMEAEHTHEQVIQSDVGGAGYCNEIHGTFAVTHTAEDGADNVVGGDKGDAYKEADPQIRQGKQDHIFKHAACGKILFHIRILSV